MYNAKFTLLSWEKVTKKEKKLAKMTNMEKTKFSNSQH
ncbi:MAG: hypothetical protein TRG1_850 [Flavobacteriaceae bacterium FS1-H7996/R]|nr:MAG: hypothetical protein TRG1_850 [Flavobacteriaceae bacterium FS1-H7996/R]